MKISTKGRYALRLMLDLAMNDTGSPVSLKDVAKRQGISDKYLEQIISVLNRAGYVKSVRGAQGGYMLRKEPEDYTVGMILRLTEGSLAPVSCGRRSMMRSVRWLTIRHYRILWTGSERKTEIMSSNSDD